MEVHTKEKSPNFLLKFINIGLTMYLDVVEVEKEIVEAKTGCCMKMATLQTLTARIAARAPLHFEKKSESSPI